LRSTNFGLSFQRTDLPIKLGANEAGRYSGERLAVDPQHHNVLYIGTRNNGLWKSTDFGANWSQVSTFPVTPPTSGVGVIFVLFQPTSTKPKQETIYVGVSDPNTGLYSSTDGGTTWSAVPGQPTGFYPTHDALGPDGMLYVTYGDGTGADGMGGQRIGNGSVWKFNAATGVWTNITRSGRGGLRICGTDSVRLRWTGNIPARLWFRASIAGGRGTKFIAAWMVEPRGLHWVQNQMVQNRARHLISPSGMPRSRHI